MSKSTKKEIGAILHKDKVTFRVWAPFAKSVAVAGSFNNWSQIPMNAEGDGYWVVDVADAQAGQEYKYVLSNGQTQFFRNDPRSLQITTNAGNSVIVDGRFDWTDKDFKTKAYNEQVIYELHVGTFNRPDPSTTGTFDGIKDKLDYLADLGITAIELMPIGSMSMDREWWGYTPDYIYAVEGLYGGRRQFLEFVNAAHSKGIAVILDVVYNHFGPDRNLDLWQFDGWSQDGKGGIYFYNDWRAKTPWAETRPDYGRSEVRQYILDNVRMWMHDSHVDGLRVDSTIFIRNAKGNNNDPANDLADGWTLMQRLNSLSRKINPNALLIAEDIGCNEYITKPVSVGGAGFNSQWEVNLPQTLRHLLDAVNDSDRNLDELNWMLNKRYNGDAFGRVIYSDSHDSAANGGARLDEEISPGHPTSIYSRKRSLLAATFILTAPGIPMLFQGQEFMQGGSFSDWQELNWTNVEKYQGIFTAHKHLVSLRRNLYGNSRGLCGQSMVIVHQNDNDKVLAYHRWDRGGANDDVIIVLNFANKMHKSYNINFPRNGLWKVRFNSSWKGYSPDFKESLLNDVSVSDKVGTLSLAPYGTLILSQGN